MTASVCGLTECRGKPKCASCTARESIAVVVQLPPEHAYALAQLCKRIGWNDCKQLSVGEHETQLMIDATNKVRAALEGAGVYVR